MLSRLNIATEGKAAMNELEWTGKYTEAPKEKGEKIVELDSDDEEDPLKILAQVCNYSILISLKCLPIFIHLYYLYVRFMYTKYIHV